MHHPTGRGRGGAQFHRVGSPNHRRQWLIGDLEQLCRILGLIDGLSHDHSDGLADKAGPIGRHRVIAGCDRLEASKPNRHIGQAHEPTAVGDRPEPILHIVAAGEHREPTRRPKRCSFVDGCNMRTGMGERTITAWANSGRLTSSAKLPLPVRRRKSSLRRTG